ncbi:MAG: PKD domain-containing protein, partial [Bacteroidia bacterium]
ITCTETNGCGTGTPVSINVATSTTPVTSPISGPSPVCANATNTTYSVISTTGSTYAWTVPSGATIVSGQGTNVIVVNWGGTGGNVGVTETSTCGTGSLVTTTVVISNAPVSSAIAGTTPICPNATNTTYSVISHPASTYTWSAPATATITAGQNTNSINVNWGTSGGVITVTESNSCGTGAPVTFIVVMNTVPVTSAITGSTTVCANSTQINYSVSNVPGNTYNWTVTGGGSIVLGQGSNSVFVNWGSTGGTVSVTQTNACGTGTAGTATVIVVNPVATGTITGTTPICPNTINTTYSVSNTIGSTYTWSVPATATITAGQNTNSVSVNWSSSGGVVTVTESNTCGSGTPVTFTVVMNASPNTGVIVGTTPVCPNATNLLYAVNNTPGSTYNWTVPSGASINSGQGSNSINVNWGTVAGNVSVVETNVCGTGTVVIYPVAVTSLAVTSPISGGNPSCANTNGITYSVTSGGTSYSWTVNGGGTIASGQGTNSININWGATGGIITCTEYNVCGAGNTVTDTVTFLNIPISTNIGGVNTVCPNQVGATYSVTSNATSTYSWSVTGGGTIVAGQTTNVIAVDWGASGGIVTCVESNMCGSGAPVSFTVVMNALPNTGAISGPSPVCANATNTTYSVVNTAGSTYVWIAPIGAIITSGQGSNIITINWNGSAGGNISVTETNSCGSGTVVVLPITVNAAPVVQITATPRNGCSPLAVTFSNTTVFTPGVTITSETWLFGDGNTSTVNNPTNVYVAAGGYNVSLTLTTNSGCTSTFSAVNFVNVYPNPHADFTYDPNTIYISEPTVHFADNSQLNIATWHWNLGDNTVLSTPNPVHSYNDAGTYTVVLAVSNQYGCVDTARKIITVKEDFNFYIPNAFTPNGDGNDDFFTGLGTAIGDFEMMIFDRWGNLVYKSNDYNQPWDGKLKQKGDIVQEDVYVYKIRVTEQDTRHEHVFNGHVSLLK